MNKKLSEMTLEELWRLFPIFLVEHRSVWNDWYAQEVKRLSTVLSNKNICFSHIGSTAVQGIQAKPIIDILAEVSLNDDLFRLKKEIIDSGYICMSEGKDRISFNKGYTENGFADKVFHLHLRRVGDNDELYFRDWLNDSPETAKLYESLKLSLWKQYEYDRDGYTNAKGDFIKKYTETAKKKYAGRYVQKEI